MVKILKTLLFAFLGAGVAYIVVGLVALSSFDSCKDNYICADGQRITWCPPCSSECIITYEYCQKSGGRWQDGFCHLNPIYFFEEKCVAAGGIWREENLLGANCDFRQCSLDEEMLKSSRGD